MSLEGVLGSVSLVEAEKSWVSQHVFDGVLELTVIC